MPHNKPVVTVEAGDGHRFELIHVASGRPRATLLFLPGMGLSARLYIGFAEALAEHGIEVYVHEWRGNGSSNRRAGRTSNWGYRELLADIAAARETVCRSAGTDCLLGGHSLGSQIACLSAAMNADRCRGLALIAGGSPFWRVFPWPMKGVMISTMFAFPALGSLFGYYPGKRVGFAGNEARDVMADWARSARSGVYRPRGVETDLEAELSKLALPVLAVDMGDDWFVPPASLRWLTGKMPGCELTERRVSSREIGRKADHYAWMKRPEFTARQVADWVG